jgi:glutathione S-transferase
MTIKVYNLNRSRSHRVVWLLEELHIPYELIALERDPISQRATIEARSIHPLGKFPIIQDGPVTLSESGAIVEYIVKKYGRGRFAPDSESPHFASYLFWMHYAEGSFSLPLMLEFFQHRMKIDNAHLQHFCKDELQRHLEFIDAHLQSSLYFVGDQLSAADVMMGFTLDFAEALGLLAPYAHIRSYLGRIGERPAYKKAAVDSAYLKKEQIEKSR